MILCECFTEEDSGRNGYSGRGGEYNGGAKGGGGYEFDHSRVGSGRHKYSSRDDQQNEEIVPYVSHRGGPDQKSTRPW